MKASYLMYDSPEKTAGDEVTLLKHRNGLIWGNHTLKVVFRKLSDHQFLLIPDGNDGCSL